MSAMDGYLRQQAAAQRLSSYMTPEDEARAKKAEQERQAEAGKTGSSIGTVIGGLAGLYLGNPVLGAQLGGAIGGAGGTMLAGGDVDPSSLVGPATEAMTASSAPNPDLKSNLPPAAGPSSGPASMEAMSPEEYRRRMNIGQGNSVDLASLVRAAYQGSLNA